MAEVTVKVFGVLRVDTHIAAEKADAERLEDVFDVLNAIVDEKYEENLKDDPSLDHPGMISFNDAVVYINGERCSKKKTKLKDGDEIWLLSPASGG